MIILTGANSIFAKDDAGITINFSFHEVIKETVQKANECGAHQWYMTWALLGWVNHFKLKVRYLQLKVIMKKRLLKIVNQNLFLNHLMVIKCIEEFNRSTVYLDGDAKLNGNIPSDKIDALKNEFIANCTTCIGFNKINADLYGLKRKDANYFQLDQGFHEEYFALEMSGILDRPRQIKGWLDSRIRGFFTGNNLL